MLNAVIDPITRCSRGPDVAARSSSIEITRFHRPIKADRIFGTHRGLPLDGDRQDAGQIAAHVDLQLAVLRHHSTTILTPRHLAAEHHHAAVRATQSLGRPEKRTMTSAATRPQFKERTTISGSRNAGTFRHGRGRRRCRLWRRQAARRASAPRERRRRSPASIASTSGKRSRRSSA